MTWASRRVEIMESSWENWVGKRIQAVRKTLGLTQEGLAERAGVHAGYVSQIERGVRTPSAKILARLAEALRVPLSHFLDPASPGSSQPIAVAERPEEPADPAAADRPEPLPGLDERELLIKEITGLVADRPIEDIRLAVLILRSIYARIDGKG